MEVQAISLSEYSIYISGEELTRRSLSPCGVTAEKALELIGEVTGGRLDGPARLELYPGRHELLIFVHRNPGRVFFARFADSEALFRAAAARAFDDPSTLFYYSDSYILAVWQDAAAQSAPLAEFGEPLRRPEGFLAHLYEHGRTLADGNAARALRGT